MASVGRGMILQNMKNNALEKDKQSKQLNSKKSALVATFGRGTSSSGLMTPSQFIKKSSSGSSISSSSTSVKSLSMPDKEDTFKKSPSTSPATSPKINQRLKEMLLNDEKTDSENVELAEQESNKQSENKKMEINSPPLEEEKSEEMLKTEDATKTITTNPFLPANNYFENPDPQQAKEVESSCSIDSEKQTTEAVTESNSIDIKPSFDEASDTSKEIFISENNDTKHGGEEKPKDLKRDIFCKEKAPERSEDEKWKLYQVERKITKIIKSITLQNLGDAFDELECLVEERPLSSRFMNCSEVELLLEALMKSAIQNADFLPLAPCLIKMVSEHQPLEFKQYFPDIVERKYKENVTLSASEEILNKNGQHFCKLVGNLFAMPRQTGNTLFDLVSPIIEEYVERWTIPDGTEVGCDGLQETKLLMEATAVKYLLLEITNKMLPCDREVEKEMEKFVWFVRESVLNAAIPKKIREIYLDGLIEVQTTNGEDGMSVSASAFEMLTATSNSQTESDADVYFESDSCYEDALPTVTDGLSSSNVELPNDTLKEEPEKDQIDLNNIELPKFDTIAMAPTIGNAFDTSRTIPKATASGSGKMAMNFTGRNEVLDDSDADIIIEDDDDDEDVTSSSIKPPPSIFLASSSSIHKDSLVHNQSNHSSPFTSTVFPKKKLPLGRGRGLARLPDFGSKDYADKPIANVNPINYSSSESSLSSENKYAACNDDLSDLKNKRPQSSSNNTISNNDHMRPAGNRNQNQNRNFNSDNNSRTNSMQQRGRFNNGSNEYTGGYGNNNNNNNGNSNNSGGAGGCGFFNDRRTANFQKNNNNRNGNNQQRGNFNRNKNSSQNNNWRDRNHNNNNNNKREERKARKMNFQPTYNNNNNNNNKNMNRDGQTQNVAVGAAASPKMSRSEKSERDGMEKVYHPNGRLEYKPKPSTKVEFGDVVPTHCLRCNSDEHFSEQCTVKNFFF